MNQEQIYSILLILVAGMINGSFALPTKYVKNWSFENIWLQYAISAFVLMPIALALWLIPNILTIYGVSDAITISAMVLGGVLFGAGQVAFALSIKLIGIGLTYVICLGLAMGLGFLLPLLVQHPERIATPFGALTIFGTLLALLGLVISSYAGKLRDQKRGEGKEGAGSSFVAGILLATFAGLTSAGQNFSFALGSPHLQKMAMDTGTTAFGTAFVFWPGFLLFTFIPYALYMLWLHQKNNSWINYKKQGSGRYWIFSLVMALFWLGSLILYSQASLLIGELGPIIGWPLFMVLIILSSTFWSLKQGEWNEASAHAMKILWIGLGSMFLSVILLGWSSQLAS
ncbi:MAG: hypothetical protein HQK50_17735 [Oligoflexia bacterium]|nr:hypothetical protein [Oligoflexia bacterium]MBF0367421.1 hypothetical protein [Oligoflexia bacterium]